MVAACGPGDANRDGMVTIDEILIAVGKGPHRLWKRLAANRTHLTICSLDEEVPAIVE